MDEMTPLARKLLKLPKINLPEQRRSERIQLTDDNLPEEIQCLVDKEQVKEIFFHSATKDFCAGFTVKMNDRNDGFDTYEIFWMKTK